MLSEIIMETRQRFIEIINENRLPLEVMELLLSNVLKDVSNQILLLTQQEKQKAAEQAMQEEKNDEVKTETEEEI